MRYSEMITEAIPTDAMRTTRYYHGTKTTAAAQAIRRDGLQPTATQSREHLAPVMGRNYITPHICYAVIYALGGVYMGHDFPDTRLKGDRYGYVFVIDGQHLADIQPDEDSVGEFLAAHTKTGWDQSVKPWRRLPPKFKPDGVDDEAKRRVWYNIGNAMTLRQFRDAIEGLIAAQASGGKRALKRLTDADKLALIGWGAHIAHGGTLPIAECWRIDKLRSKEIIKDCSNFFEIAERIA